ncbi:MAG TPA: CRTAC1 family protein [Thermoanaerobaculia bacterium]|nr:CRTAC1 family protein [Thermoanaerobaculia bacterium]
MVLPAFLLVLAGPATADPPIRFEDVTDAAGVAFTHTTRDFGDRHKAQVLEMFTDGGAAVAVGDFDGDGHDDLFVTDSGEGKPNRLYRNLYGETGELRFAEMAAEAGVAGGNDPLSVVADALWLDFDDDGHLDLLVARFGTPLLYRNLGPGARVRFQEVSAEAGLTKFANTIAVIAFDYDGDGWLDLLLGNYFPPENLLDLDDNRQVLPNDLDGADNGGGVSLWRNVAGGSDATGGRAFVEVTEEAGLAHHTGWSLDLGHADLDNDGDQDVYVAGDYGTDRLFLNNGDGTFEDATVRALGGFDTKKGMNVDVADYDRDGWLDVYVTNITDEYMRECNMLWHNQGTCPEGGSDGLTFLDVSGETGTCDTDWGWAAKFADFDNDGWEDLFVVNGLRSAGPENYIPLLVETIVTPGIDFSSLDSYPDIGDRTWSGYQPQRLFRNLGGGAFREMAAEAGVGNDADGRGIGLGDFDSDGRLDLYQSNVHGPSFLFRNVTEGAGRWIALRLEGAGVAAGGSNRKAIGARVTVTAKGGETYLREVNGGNGYASQSTTTLHFGLGRAEAVERIEIRWPAGRIEVLETKDGRPPVPLNAVTVIAEGQGVAR